MKLSKLIPIATLASVPAIAMTSITACSKANVIKANYYDSTHDFLYQKTAKSISKGKTYTVDFDLTKWGGTGSIGTNNWFVCIEDDAFLSHINFDYKKATVKIGKKSLKNAEGIGSIEELAEGSFGFMNVSKGGRDYPSIVAHGSELGKGTSLKVTFVPSTKAKAHFCFALISEE